MSRVFLASVGQFIVLVAVLALAEFAPAGTLFWPAGWAFLLLFGGFFLGTNVWLAKNNPGLLQERLRLARPDQQGWDKFLFPILYLFPAAWLAFISLDAVRFHWSNVPAWIQGLGLLILFASFALFFLTFRENTYLSTVVRIQEERGHQVISSGPYRIVRHPMYTGIVLFMAGTPLLLGSWYGLLLGLVLDILLVRRTILEERTLTQGLEGYSAYMGRVRYRFIPHIW